MLITVVALAALALCPSARQAQSKAPPVTNEAIPFDNVAGRLVQFGTAGMHPLELSQDGSGLYALNQPRAHLPLLDPLTLARVGDVQIRIGAVSGMERPGTDELWVVDSLDFTVTGVDTSLRAPLA